MAQIKEVREQRYLCGAYMEVDLIPLFPTGRREQADPEQVSTEIQRNLNSKNSKRNLRRLILANFSEKDLFVTYTCNDDFFIGEEKESEREFNNLIRRINDRGKKKGLPNARYIGVIEAVIRQSGEHKGKISYHFHLVINGELGMDLLTDAWTARRRKGEKERRRRGTVKMSPLELRGDGIDRLVTYLVGKEKREAQEEIGVVRGKHKRRWKSSLNLKKPKRPRPNNSKYSNRWVHRTVANHLKDPSYWEEIYSGSAGKEWEYEKSEAEFNEVTQRWSIYLRMRERRE